MRKIRFTEHQIIAVLKSVVKLNVPSRIVCREAAISEASYYSTGRQSMAGWKRSILKKSKIWKTRIGGLNRCLLISALECRALKDVIEKSFKTSDKA